jgi:hypothetical protein
MGYINTMEDYSGKKKLGEAVIEHLPSMHAQDPRSFNPILHMKF